MTDQTTIKRDSYTLRILREQRDQAQEEARRLRAFVREVANTNNAHAEKARELLGV